MSRKTFTDEFAFIECDGCGYALIEAVKSGSDKDTDKNVPITLKVRNRTFHFHDSVSHNHSCFKYWLCNLAPHGLADTVAVLLGDESVSVKAR